MSTLREHLEAIRDRHKAVRDWSEDSPFCAVCDEHWQCPDIRDAVAALAILDAADTTYGNEKTSRHPYWRIVWDADALDPEASA